MGPGSCRVLGAGAILLYDEQVNHFCTSEETANE